MMWTRNVILCWLFIGAVIAESLDKIPPEIVAIEEKCIKNGGEGAFKKFMNRGNDFYNCLSEIAVAINLWKTKPDNPDENLAVSKRACPYERQFKDCYTNKTIVEVACMAPEYRDLSWEANEMAGKAIKYLCHDNAQEIAQFFADGGFGCFKQKENPLYDCVKPLLVRGSIKLEYDVNFCTILQDAKTCVTRTLAECSSPKPSIQFESFANYVWDVMPCSNLGIKNYPETSITTNRMMHREAKINAHSLAPASLPTRLLLLFECSLPLLVYFLL